MLRDKGVDIPLIVFQTPSSNQNLVVRSLSDKGVNGLDERKIVEGKTSGLKGMPGVFDGMSVQELTESMRKPQYYRRSDGVLSLRDIAGEYLNIENGRRRTTGQPEAHHGTVYMFGHQGLFGAGVRDEDTIASRLQALIPDKRVENCSNYWRFGDWEMSLLGRLLDSIPFTNGDVIALQCQNWWSVHSLVSPTMRFAGFDSQWRKVDCQSLFQTPDAPDLFLLPDSSLAPWGNQMVAEALQKAILGAV